MKKIICTPVLLFIGFVFIFSSCKNFGKKVKVEGTKGEVFYKAGATEDDAQKTGSFLKKEGFLTNDREASIQLSKDGEKYLVRFVYSKEFYDSKPGLEDVFRIYGAKMSKELFNNKEVNIALADKYFKDFKSIPFDATAINKLEEPEEGTFSKADYDHDSAGGVQFYWKGISDEESKTIADYIVKNGGFAGGTAEIYMTKEGDKYFLRFPVKEEYRTDAATIDAVEKISKEIKANVFANSPFSFQMTDEYLKPLKSFDY